MKKIKSLLIIGSLLLVGFASFAQTPSITYRFNNLKIVPGVTYDTLYFDVEAKSNVGTTYTTGFNIQINFSTTAFGSNAVPVAAEQLVLTQPSGYNFNTLFVSADANTFGASFIAFRILPPFLGTYDITYLSNLTTDFQGVVRYKMLITGTGPAGIEYYLTGPASMITGNHYVLTSGGTTTTNYTPVLGDNDLLTLPTEPNLSLMISEVGDPSNSTTNFVEVYNAGASALDFTNHYPWFLNFNGSSSVQLTGTLAAGSAYTIAYDNVDFTPDLVSTDVGTGGATTYLLTTYGDYTDGTQIDTYDGSATGFDFTGKQAVRHYNVVAPNLTPDLSEWVIRAAQNSDMTAGSHRATLTWNGSVDGDWRTKGNWTSFIPDAGHNASVPTAGSTPVIGNGDNAYAHDLAITGDLFIESDEINGDGSLITYGTVTGSAMVQRFLAADRFWYVTQPVTSATANVFLHTWLFTYNEGSSDWDPFIEDETTPLGVMKGFAVWTSSINKYDQDLPPLGDTTTAYSGTLNTGAVSTGLTNGGDGWNFVGNPYVSAVDWDATGWTKTGLATDAYYVWNGTTYSSYVAGGPGTNGGTQYIPAAQGFFVQTNAAGTLGVSNAVRTHSTQSFWKSDETIENMLSLTISNGEVSDESLIRFSENATKELDYSFDARKFMAESSPQLYSMMGTDKMSINTLNNTIESPSVTLGINAPAEGQYTITASNIESFDASIPIYLEDIVTGQKISLREISTYSFGSQEGLAERFVVHFTEFQGIGDQLIADVNSIYAVNKMVYIDFSGEKGEIAIYDILGQEIARSAASNGMNTIAINQGNAVYIVKVISDNNAVTKKVFVK